MHEPLAADTRTTSGTAPANARPAATPDPDIEIDKELAVMKTRIEQLEAELKSRAATRRSAACRGSGGGKV